MHLIYIDDSGDEELCVFSALMIRADKWNACLEKIKNFRRDIQTSDGISVYTEFHAWKFVSGRGRIADRVVTKGRRCQIFKQTFFIQLSDFCAYALLRQEHPIESKTKYGLDEAFNLLDPISEGIIRPNP